MKREFESKAISVVYLILLVMSVIANVIGIVRDSGGIMQYVFNLIAVIAAMAYFFIRYTKSGNAYYRFFAGFLALKEMLAIINTALNESVPAFVFIIFIVCYSVNLLIAVAKDLGKKVSYSLAITQIILSALTFVMVAINAQYLYSLVYNSTRLLLALVLLLMVWAKYKDKESRNTK